MAFTVKAVAELAGISIRTLHYYDEIELLKPAAVSPAGYRLYTEADLERLQQVLFYRELGFGLQEIKAVLDSPRFDRRQALLQHREALHRQQERLGALIASVDRTLEAMERGIPMDEKEMFEGFDHTQYEEEARQRWGHTEAYQESQRRAKSYTKADWAAIEQESQAINEGVASGMDRGPDDPAVQEWVCRWHQLINDRFYPCSPEVFRGLGEMYVADPRFAAHYEKIRPGMATFLRDAMIIYCDRLQGA